MTFAGRYLRFDWYTSQGFWQPVYMPMRWWLH